MFIELDDIDLRILDLMQANARISNADLARELAMAPSAVLERVKKLEQKKVILQYNTAINPTALNQKLLAFIFIKTKEIGSDSSIAASLAKVPEVQEVHIVAGEDCFLVKVRTEDSASLMAMMRKAIKRIPNVLSTKTTIVLETVKEQQQLVIPKN
ncbi:Lrp/AsnC family transcriptional regulator [Pseudoflavitalea sp. X16]|uniref:Lrp/AsnC family transcriptional regulator n=1 Tax=Paraflavitalea devenefica TaxID=2716334 RepID=UPI00141FB02E|nr:Lrp/AsnC family transcriptional regulator [Paraflavitalea devenefica]NII26959.1 Lrp/AsnC family transcriptional regulator [Paraflavitalea devenefica]